MAKKKVGVIFDWRSLSPMVAIFRLRPENGSRFPEYEAGQYIALHRENCRIIKLMGTSPEGQPLYGPDLDEDGRQRSGPVTRSYSISSAPFETRQQNYLEFFVNLEKDDIHYPGKLVESLFLMDLQEGSKVTYFHAVGGDFTLRQRASGYQNVLMVGTGTGLAPFVGMVKELFHQKENAGIRYTLLHATRRYEELGYLQEFRDMESSKILDFRYIPLVSRPTQRDWNDTMIGKGRANNLLRHIFAMPLQPAAKVIEPVLPSNIAAAELRDRIDSPNTVLLACGNPLSLNDLKLIAASQSIRFEKEEW